MPARKAARNVSLQLEALEDRIVPSSSTSTSPPPASPPAPPPSPAASVTTTTSPPPVTSYTVGAGDVATLIKDINAANNTPGTPITINLTDGTYIFTQADNNTSGPNALPVITGNIAINGNGAVLLRDPSMGQTTPFRFFDVAGASSTSTSGGQSTTTPAGSLTLSNVTLEDGLVDSDGSGTIGGGGAILNQGNLNLNGVTVDNSSAAGSNSTGTSTSGPTFGGGAIANLYGTTTLINCTLVSNLSSGGQGGGYGGAIFNVDGTVNVSSCTLATNSAISGGAIYNYATSTATDSAPTATVTLNNSILADSFGSNDLINDENSSLKGAATVNSNGNNIVMTMSALDGATINGTPNNANPLLGLLSYNGGSTPTVTLQAGSPALGTGTSGSNTPTTDQRGVARGPVVDVGAVQQTPATAIATALSLASSVISGSTNVTLTATVTPNSTATAGGSVDFKDTKTNTDLGSSAVTNGQATLTISQSVAGDPITATYTNASGTAGPSTATLNSNASSGSPPAAPASPPPAGGNPSATNSFISLFDSFLPALSGLLSIPVIGTTMPSSPPSAASGTSAAGGTTPASTLANLLLSNGTTTGGGGGVFLSGASSGTPTGLNLTSGTTSAGQIPTQISSWLNQVWGVLFPNTTIQPSQLNTYATMLESGVSPATIVQDLEQLPDYHQSEVEAAYKFLGVTSTSLDVQSLTTLMNAGVPLQGILALIAGSDAFFQNSGGTNQDFLNAIYKDLLAAPAVDPTSQLTLGTLLNDGVPRWAIAAYVVTSPTFYNELVLLDFQTYVPSQLTNSNTLINIVPDYAQQLEEGQLTNDGLVANLLASLYTGTSPLM